MKLGILGGGQLGRMLAESAKNINVEVVVVDESKDCSASHVIDVAVKSFDSVDEIKKIFADVDAITYEFENIPIELLKALAIDKPVYPPIDALEVSRHRQKEKNFAKKHGIPTPEFLIVENSEDLDKQKHNISFPVIIKTCTEGYDGKGQWRFNSLDEFDAQGIGSISKQLIAEEKITFDLEFSIIATRDITGNIETYPACYNVHDQGTLAYTLAPSSLIKDQVFEKAREATHIILNELSYVGTIAVEYFLKDDNIYFNEFAPRVHNSGHWTIEGADTSQFENHVRACVGLELGSTKPHSSSLMINLLGVTGDKEKLTQIAESHYHWYDKSGLGNRRKVGHVNILYSSEEEREKHISVVTKLCGFSF